MIVMHGMWRAAEEGNPDCFRGAETKTLAGGRGFALGIARQSIDIPAALIGAPFFSISVTRSVAVFGRAALGRRRRWCRREQLLLHRRVSIAVDGGVVKFLDDRRGRALGREEANQVEASNP